MASNPYVNKVIVNNQTLIDLTADTVDAAHLAQGYTAHDLSGAPIVGTMSGGVQLNNHYKPYNRANAFTNVGDMYYAQLTSYNDNQQDYIYDITPQTTTNNVIDNTATALTDMKILRVCRAGTDEVTYDNYFIFYTKSTSITFTNVYVTVYNSITNTFGEHKQLTSNAASNQLDWSTINFYQSSTGNIYYSVAARKNSSSRADYLDFKKVVYSNGAFSFNDCGTAIFTGLSSASSFWECYCHYGNGKYVYRTGAQRTAGSPKLTYSLYNIDTDTEVAYGSIDLNTVTGRSYNYSSDNFPNSFYYDETANTLHFVVGKGTDVYIDYFTYNLTTQTYSASTSIAADGLTYSQSSAYGGYHKNIKCCICKDDVVNFITTNGYSGSNYMCLHKYRISTSEYSKYITTCNNCAYTGHNYHYPMTVSNLLGDAYLVTSYLDTCNSSDKPLIFNAAAVTLSRDGINSYKLAQVNTYMPYVLGDKVVTRNGDLYISFMVRQSSGTGGVNVYAHTPKGMSNNYRPSAYNGYYNEGTFKVGWSTPTYQSAICTNNTFDNDGYFYVFTLNYLADTGIRISVSKASFSAAASLPILKDISNYSSVTSSAYVQPLRLINIGDTANRNYYYSILDELNCNL